MARKGGGDGKKGGPGTGRSRKKTDKGGARNKKGGSSEKDLIKQLSTILKELDEEGLRFLLQQALVLQHNMQVQKLQEELGKTSGKSGGKKRAPQTAADDVDVKEGEDGSHFIIIMRNYRNFFDRGEMKKIVQMCHASSDAGDAARRLFNWFAQNRKDVLNNSSIHERTDPVLSNMYTFLINRYTVKEDS